MGHPDEVREWVATGLSDIGFAAGPVVRDPRLVERTFATDRLVVLAPVDHPWAHRGSIDLAALAATPLIVREERSGTRRSLDDALAAAGLRVEPALTLASTGGIRRAVAGQGIPGVLSQLSVDDGGDVEFVVVPIEDPAVERALTVLHRRHAPPSSHQRRFLGGARIGGGPSALDALRAPLPAEGHAVLDKQGDGDDREHDREGA